MNSDWWQLQLQHTTLAKIRSGTSCWKSDSQPCIHLNFCLTSVLEEVSVGIMKSEAQLKSLKLPRCSQEIGDDCVLLPHSRLPWPNLIQSVGSLGFPPGDSAFGTPTLGVKDTVCMSRARLSTPCTFSYHCPRGLCGLVVDCLLWGWKVIGSLLGRVIPKIKMGPIAPLLGSQHQGLDFRPIVKG